MNISDMQKEAWQTSEDHGFHKGEGSIPREYVVATKIALIDSEAAEVLEAIRQPQIISGQEFMLWFGDGGKPEGPAAELADIVIRVGDLAEILGINLQAAVAEKMRYNKSRPYKHGGKTI